MKLLFKQEGFPQDIKKVIGIIDADLSWDRLRPSLEIATDEIVDIIGENNYSTINVETVPEGSQRFFELVKFAIAFKAYMHYAPTGDLAMTNKGRTMRRDEYEVGAFEWQISNHNESLERFFYKHMNLLFKFMVKNNLIINLEKYKHDALIVPTLAEFEAHYGLNESYFLYLNLLPGLREFEDLEMLSRIGEDLYNDRNALKDKKVLHNYLQKSAVYYSIEWGLRHLDIQMFPKSILRSTESSEGSKSKSALLPTDLALIFEKDCNRYLKKVENEMTSFRVTVPSEDFRLPDLDFDDDDNFVST
ncbi:hypothetical protein EG346_15935 [Chryseobacterium carnipullorum]|uniref:Uncharacterized protein n=1 Tax=Chryseobacterium carnipullorum TaxID=1124835 RepID=A0A376DSK2_CHRCU|nr:DUF6712 family protein [Chryseobacterium carnipullorum]AZA49576.1 hypothetical protein EG346_15935 [Chryseobacterium carnipullorum]AZA64474.1 hypothetical protein EG345_06955 [Chryseobacterium carnipullorum]STC94870.1 Uncharacterised protein [Chryseobacterium carnipullorum]